LFWVLKIHVVTLCHKGLVAFLGSEHLAFQPWKPVMASLG